ncbi:hypothetical protein BC830DRAFT_1097973 [Chytriomyces sp. MP71]|nr:hypothetical protein BC830DRAFT_1097973 [Chytriomyces sp. MP71]
MGCSPSKAADSSMRSHINTKPTAPAAPTNPPKIINVTKTKGEELSAQSVPSIIAFDTEGGQFVLHELKERQTTEDVAAAAAEQKAWIVLPAGKPDRVPRLIFVF